MVQSTAPDADSYLAEVPEGRRGVLTAIRDACREELAGFEERMDHGMQVGLDLARPMLRATAATRGPVR